MVDTKESLMKLFLVKRTVEYEGTVLCGIYSTIEKAHYRANEVLNIRPDRRYRKVGANRWNYEDIWIEIQVVELDEKITNF